MSSMVLRNTDRQDMPVEAHRVEGVKNFMLQIYQTEVKTPQTLTYDQAWTPMKRLASVMDQAPEEQDLAEAEG